VYEFSMDYADIKTGINKETCNRLIIFAGEFHDDSCITFQAFERVSQLF
jgi:hypothetical protein